MSEFIFSIELVYNTSTKLLRSVPKTIKELSNEVLNSLAVSGVIFKYMDEEGDLITISTDKELLESYQILKELHINVFKILVEPGPGFKKYDDIEINDNYISTVKSLLRNEMEKSIGYEKNNETVWRSVTCDGCQDLPIIGVRFKCTVCDNYDLCEFCEMTAQHPHPFLKLTSLDHNIDMIKVTLDKPGTNFKKAIMSKKFKMKFLHHISYVEGEKVKPGQEMEKIWRVKNIGNEDWPSGCRARFVRGDLDGVGYEIGPIRSGESIDLIASITIPSTEGRYTAVWRLFTPDNISFGDKLYVIVQSLSPT
jgi:Ig-like domain from next to BRCA1 gene/Zinc finger, ZZ type/PB1 domain